MIIYKTTNLVNNKIYIGQDANNDSNYLGSGTILIKAIRKYGRKNFKKEILETCETLEQLNIREIYWIDRLNSRNHEIGYNISFGGQKTQWKGLKHSEETKNKISTALKGKKTWNKDLTNIYSEETKNKMSVAHKGNTKFLNKTHTNESKEKMSIAHTGIKFSEETKNKMSVAHKGKIGWLKGKTQKPEVRTKISNSLKKEILMIKNLEIINSWDSAEIASKALGVSIKTIGNYCRKKNNEENKFGIIYKKDYEQQKKETFNQ